MTQNRPVAIVAVSLWVLQFIFELNEKKLVHKTSKYTGNRMVRPATPTRTLGVT